MSVTPELGWPLAFALVVLVLMAVAAASVDRMPIRREVVVACGRAVLQLSLVSVAIAAVLGDLALSAAFAVLMFCVAVWTSSRRIGATHDALWVAIAVGSGVVPVLTLLLASGVIPLRGAAIVPTAGIVIGGAMTANTLAGRRAFDELRSQVGSYEAALALGLPPAAATLEIVQPTAPEALTPVLDQTRTVGLVTLPGAYVGVLLGGGSPFDAGAAQIMVLVGLLAAETNVVLVLTRLIAARRVLPPALRTALAT
jgi:putative ABC transport system permease protein